MLIRKHRGILSRSITKKQANYLAITADCH